MGWIQWLALESLGGFLAAGYFILLHKIQHVFGAKGKGEHSQR